MNRNDDMRLEARNREIKRTVSVSNILTSREEDKESKLFLGRRTHGEQVPIVTLLA
jgi:hypothetical protein